MDQNRQRQHLQDLFSRNTRTDTVELLPVVNRWEAVLNRIPGLAKRRPGSHSRISELRGSVLTIEVDHPGWMQLFQWYQNAIVEQLNLHFPELAIQALQWRLFKGGEPIVRPWVVMPDPVKPEMNSEEQEKFDEVLGELEALIRRNAPNG